MESSAGSGEEPHVRVRQQEVVAELGQQALETDDLDQLMHDASVAVADTLDDDYCKVLELLPGGNEWIVSVSDDGVGIDPADQERIFEIFQQGYSTEESPGTGIGLALCERIIERHGSDIGLKSDPGEGVTFSFTLPAVQEESDG